MPIPLPARKNEKRTYEKPVNGQVVYRCAYCQQLNPEGNLNCAHCGAQRKEDDKAVAA